MRGIRAMWEAEITTPSQGDAVFGSGGAVRSFAKGSVPSLAFSQAAIYVTEIF
ncbi:hypothetical protein [Aminobacter sp. MET-1]|uniref:hypothetical protein n=1 Tax=Aminobacter sp. MET-1 TaxID=2951085 RepID=UPI00226AAA55|nr:hypothetical protein [Aminobacter sp. MET-1]MCX8569516.1 hypothetical protein [Aminobacter sp. MET-1]